MIAGDTKSVTCLHHVHYKAKRLNIFGSPVAQISKKYSFAVYRRLGKAIININFITKSCQ
jgi:hypothetical protein